MLTVGYLRQAQRARLLRLSNPRRSCKPTPRVLQTIWEPGPVWDRNSPGVVRWQMEPYLRALKVMLAHPSSRTPTFGRDWWPLRVVVDPTMPPDRMEVRSGRNKVTAFNLAVPTPPEWEEPNLLDPHPCRIKRRP